MVIFFCFWIDPLSGSSSPVSILSSDDLPVPFDPTRHILSPELIFRLTFWKRYSPVNWREMLEKSIIKRNEELLPQNGDFTGHNVVSFGIKSNNYINTGTNQFSVVIFTIPVSSSSGVIPHFFL